MSLKDLKIQAFTEPVSDLPDNPSQSGITAEELKRRFDANANNELKPSVNGIVDFLLGFTNGEEIKGIRLDEDNVVEVTKDGTNYISTGYSKEYITDMLADKADKSDVLLKTNTEEFTPTDTYQPATKKYVDDKVISAGAGDMTQAVYDPTGRQTDIFAEVDKKFDKTGGVLSGDLEIKNGYGRFIADGQLVQIEAVNKNSEQTDKRILQISNYADRELSKALKFYDAKNGTTTSYNLYGEHNKSLMAESFLPLTDGILTGDLRMKKSVPQIVLTNTANNRYYNVFVGGDGIVYFRNAVDNNNRTAFFLNPETIGDFAKVFRLQKVIDGQASYYNIFGEHNKPSGSYTGNGSSTERVINLGINVGDSEVLVLHSIHGSVIVTRANALALNGSTSTSMPYSKVHLENEKNGLVINSTDTALNQNGTTYYYRVL